MLFDGKNFFNQPVKNDIKAYEKIRKITTGQGDDYTSGCLLDYNQFNLPYLQLNKLTLKLSSIDVGNSNDQNNFRHKLLLTNTQVPRLRKAFANGSSANIKLSKTQLPKIRQSGESLDKLLGHY